MKGKRPKPKNEVRVYRTASELAARTGLSIRYFQALAKRVAFASQPEPGGRILFDAAGFEAWIEAGRPKPATDKPPRERLRRRPTSPLLDKSRPLQEVLREMRLKRKR